jgi:pantoate--beta-alanine ligase
MSADTVRTRAEARDWVLSRRAEGLRIGLVPTMGALHAGHLSLIRAAAAECDVVVVSIFVNPTQFGPSEDLERYPRRLEADLQAAGAAGARLVFAPEPEEMYAADAATWVTVEGLTDRLCGAARPGHFRGVATVVAKLFHILPAHTAYFGRKDFQQSVVIRRMVRDLDFDIQVRVMPTVREPDGLALSSRNAYLGPEERRRARCLVHALEEARRLFGEGRRDRMTLVRAMGEVVRREAPGANVEYIEVVDPETLEPAACAEEDSVALLAVRIGATRLIDNLPLVAPPDPVLPGA